MQAVVAMRLRWTALIKRWRGKMFRRFRIRRFSAFAAELRVGTIQRDVGRIRAQYHSTDVAGF